MLRVTELKLSLGHPPEALPLRLGRQAPPLHVRADPHAALSRARELAGRGGAVLVGGSLYLLEDLSDVVTPAR